MSEPDQDGMQREYGWILDLFKTDLDIHYRRQQMMLTLESALLVGFAFKDSGPSVISLLICLLGIGLTELWRKQTVKQRVFLELRRRMLRELEAQMSCTVKLMTIDKLIFHDGQIHRFEKTKEFFPDNTGSFVRDRIKGSTTEWEIWITWAFNVVWGMLLVRLAYQSFR